MSKALTELYDTTLKLLVPIEDIETYRIIIEESIKRTGAEFGSIFLADKKNNLKRVFSTVPMELRLEPTKNGYTYRAFKSGEPQIISPSILKRHHPEVKGTRIKFIVIIPLAHGGKTFGVLTLQSTKRLRFSQKKMQLLKLFGSVISLKIRNNLLYSEIKSALETRDLFISMASHELKTPLTTISAYSQLIQKKLTEKKEINPQWAEVLNFATVRMTRLINELLHVNQIKTGKMPYHFGKTSLTEVVHEALTDFKSSHPKHKIRLRNKLNNQSDFIRADKSKILQVAINVLNNAAKFSSFEKPITITLEKRSNRRILIVEDRGKGIDKESMGHLFEEFYKVGNDTQEGLGLGLFISKKIIEAHKGKISIASKLGVGTMVTISVPEY